MFLLFRFRDNKVQGNYILRRGRRNDWAVDLGGIGVHWGISVTVLGAMSYAIINVFSALSYCVLGIDGSRIPLDL